jgi:hypothetical protein
MTIIYAKLPLLKRKQLKNPSIMTTLTQSNQVPANALDRLDLVLKVAGIVTAVAVGLFLAGVGF